MPIIDELHAASYKGAVFYVTTAATRGGRKIAQKAIAASDRQVLEDLGLTPRAFSVVGIIAPVYGTDGEETTSYLQARDKLLRALESQGPGTLVHPFYGTIADAVCMPPYELSESMAALDQGEITLRFEISQPDSIRPVATAAGDSLSETLAANEALQDKAELSFGEKFAVLTTDVGNFADSLTQQNDFLDFVDGVTSGLSLTAQTAATISNTLNVYRTNVSSLINAPVELASQFSTLMTDVNQFFDVTLVSPGDVFSVVGDVLRGTGDQFRDTLDIFKRFFGFGDDDTEGATSTVTLVSRAENRESFNVMFNVAALGYQYENAAQRQYTTVVQIDADLDILEANYEALRSRLDPEIQIALSDLRLAALEFFRQKKLSLSRVEERYVHPTSTRLLSFSLYGDSILGDALAALNDLNDPALIGGGRVEVFVAAPNGDEPGTADAA